VGPRVGLKFWHSNHGPVTVPIVLHVIEPCFYSKPCLHFCFSVDGCLYLFLWCWEVMCDPYSFAFSAAKRPDRPWGPPILLFSGYRGLFPGVKWPGIGVHNSPPFTAELKERVAPYLCLRHRITPGVHRYDLQLYPYTALLHNVSELNIVSLRLNRMLIHPASAEKITKTSVGGDQAAVRALFLPNRKQQ
jgi:hypothetical protein